MFKLKYINEINNEVVLELEKFEFVPRKGEDVMIEGVLHYITRVVWKHYSTPGSSVNVYMRRSKT